MRVAKHARTRHNGLSRKKQTLIGPASDVNFDDFDKLELEDQNDTQKECILG